uniref:Uncharacterized protein n=1 Tax=Phasianus colchicus TaxID=9054 RepID=A0A669Q352_PHACC
MCIRICVYVYARCVCIYICMCVCIYIQNTCVFICAYTRIHLYTRTYAHPRPPATHGDVSPNSS